jgi:hypothetical protein
LDETHRPALLGYSDVFLNHAMEITAGMTVMAYATYSMESDVLIPERKFAAVPFVVFVILDYLRQCYVGGGGSPVEMVLKAPTIVAAVAGWFLATIWSLGLL